MSELARLVCPSCGHLLAKSAGTPEQVALMIALLQMRCRRCKLVTSVTIATKAGTQTAS